MNAISGLVNSITGTTQNNTLTTTTGGPTGSAVASPLSGGMIFGVVMVFLIVGGVIYWISRSE
jgi:uncharacterized membrane protein YdbT with pleckstrin-like domain